MKEKILASLKKLEEKHNIRFIFAIESGSRAWGFASEDSDYDVRAIHCSSIDAYLGIKLIKPQIETMQGDIDIVSWDIKKFASLLLKSNPSISEWLESDQVYINSMYRKKFREIFKKYFSRHALKKHYISLARQNYEKYIRNKDEVNLKKYVYVLRAIACVEYLKKYRNVPPLKYKKTTTYLPKYAQEFMEKIVIQKQASEKLKGAPNKKVNKLIETYFTKKIRKEEASFDKEEIEKLVIEVIKHYNLRNR